MRGSSAEEVAERVLGQPSLSGLQVNLKTHASLLLEALTGCLYWMRRFSEGVIPPNLSIHIKNFFYSNEDKSNSFYIELNDYRFECGCLD